MPNRLLSYASVAEILDVSEKTVRRMVKDGRLPPPMETRVGLRFSEMEIYRWLFSPNPRQEQKGRDKSGQHGTNLPGGKDS